eukprot:GHRR01026523.1.p1 GENE.GHRR01026523.1~~GHRR01026523.1.p1  ORF type:complete len:104 (+),score=12.54 GHRR01026523.1:982-1293(+)
MLQMITGLERSFFGSKKTALSKHGDCNCMPASMLAHHEIVWSLWLATGCTCQAHSLQQWCLHYYYDVAGMPSTQLLMLLSLLLVASRYMPVNFTLRFYLLDAP